jgi:hypothetical protein
VSCASRHLPLAVMSESEWFLRTFVPAPGYNVWIRVGFVPIYSVGIKVVLWTPVPICSVWIGDILEQLYLFILSDSEKFFRRHVLICCVWFRVVFQETCPYLLCLNQSCFCRHQSLFVVSESELFLRTPVLICSVWIRVVFEDTSLYL